MRFIPNCGRRSLWVLFLRAVGRFVNASCVCTRHFRQLDRSYRHLFAQLYLRHVRFPFAREQTESMFLLQKSPSLFSPLLRMICSRLRLDHIIHFRHLPVLPLFYQLCKELHAGGGEQMRDYQVYDLWRNHVQTSSYGPRLHLCPHPVPRPGLFLWSLCTVVHRSF